MLDALEIQFKGMHKKARLAAAIMLGIQMDHEKISRGYQGGGSWVYYYHETKRGERGPWKQFCIEKTGFTDRSIQNFYEFAMVAKDKLRRSNNPAAPALLQCFKRPLTELTTEERHNFKLGLIIVALHIDDSTLSLKKEFDKLLPAGSKVRRLEEPYTGEDLAPVIPLATAIAGETERVLSLTTKALLARGLQATFAALPEEARWKMLGRLAGTFNRFTKP